MLRLKIAFVASLVILGLLLAFAVFGPMTSGEVYSKVARESVIKDENRWIIQFDIINREGKIARYTITWAEGGRTYSEKVSIKDGRTFTYIHYVYPERVKDGEVNLVIYKEGESIPFEEATYYLK